MAYIEIHIDEKQFKLLKDTVGEWSKHDPDILQTSGADRIKFRVKKGRGGIDGRKRRRMPF